MLSGAVQLVRETCKYCLSTRSFFTPKGKTMKKNSAIIFALIISTFFALNKVGISSAKEKANGTIGDVKYSLLNPDQFKAQNGKGWVLMDGSEIKGTDLANFVDIKNVPDARGVFIRGMNLQRDAEEGDPEGNRSPGSLQMDSFQGHGHVHEQSGGGEFAPGTFQGVYGNDKYLSNRILEPSSIKRFGTARFGSETRPKNIALYVYIKVNE